MQLSMLYRRGAVVPLDSDAAQQLDKYQVTENTSVQYVRITTQQNFEYMWNAGLFHSINQKLGIMLDDYETESIEPGQVMMLKGVLLDYADKDIADVAMLQFLHGVIGLCDIAVRDSVSIYFVL
jgi:hypothetical protein